MGSGKSRIGHALAERLNWPFRDSDIEIQKKAGKTISEIFETSGEAAFRKMEWVWCQKLGKLKNCVVSTGGGIVGSQANRDLLRYHGQVIWLKASAETILIRTQKTRKRPLLNVENPQEKIEMLLAERLPLYQKTAHFEVDTENQSVEQVVDEILQKTSVIK